jgi:hypothetical protein
MPNPVNQTIDLSGNTGLAAGHLAGTTNAGFTQQAIVSVTDKNGKVVASGTFQGNGENNTPISLTTGGTVLSFSGAQLPLTLNVQFNYDPNGRFTPNQANKVVVNTLVDTKSLEAIQMTSEDYVDNDFNDLILTCVVLGH